MLVDCRTSFRKIRKLEFLKTRIALEVVVSFLVIFELVRQHMSLFSERTHNFAEKTNILEAFVTPILSIFVFYNKPTMAKNCVLQDVKQ